jgi:hypothetical protein
MEFEGCYIRQGHSGKCSDDNIDNYDRFSASQALIGYLRSNRMSNQRTIRGFFRPVLRICGMEQGARIVRHRSQSSKNGIAGA